MSDIGSHQALAAVGDRRLREMLSLASVTRVCVTCGRTKKMMPDDIQCTQCEEDGVGPADVIGEDLGWRR